jgi:hypothetical protein
VIDMHRERKLKKEAREIEIAKLKSEDANYIPEEHAAAKKKQNPFLRVLCSIVNLI